MLPWQSILRKLSGRRQQRPYSSSQSAESAEAHRHSPAAACQSMGGSCTWLHPATPALWLWYLSALQCTQSCQHESMQYLTVWVLRSKHRVTPAVT